MSIADKLVTIAENQSKVYDAGKLDVLRDSKYMNATASGAVVAVNDVSSIEHDVVVKVGSKNLLPYPYYNADERAHNGVTFTVNADGTINATGTATATAYYYLAHSTEIKFDCEATISAKGLTADIGVVYVVDGTPIYLTTNNQSRQVQANAVISSIRVYINGGATVDVSGVAVQIEKGTTATPYTPYTENLEGVTVKRYGKNLLPCPYVSKNNTAAGIAYTVNEDGSITMNGTATGVSTFAVFGKGAGANATPFGSAFIIGEKYMYSTKEVLPVGVQICNFIYKSGGGTTGRNIESGTSGKTITISEDGLGLYSYIRIDPGTVIDNFTIYPMIEKGTVATDYEPFAEVEYAPNADGTLTIPSSQIMTLATDTDGVTTTCSYLRDIDTYIDKLFVDIALTGGN